ncbi:MAG: energy-coupling factor transporter transmembrane protein EcfT, partial [Tissierellaceae bacterium]
MLKDITIGQYFPGNTLIHKLDPRIKIIIVSLFIFSLFFIRDFTPYIFILGFILLVVKISKVPLKFILKGIRPLLFIILITFFINIFMTRGEVIFELGPLTITKEGLRLGFFMA